MNNPPSAASELDSPDLHQTPGQDGSVDRKDSRRIEITPILRLFWVKRRTIFGIVTAGTLLSALYAFMLTPMYTSTISLMPPETASSSSNLMSLLSTAGPAASAGSAMLGVKTPGALFSGILGSRTVREILVSRFDLVSYYKVRLVEDACKHLAANTSISENTRTGIITISVSDKNPVLASHLSQGYVAELNHIVTDHSTSSARRERLFLEERLKQIQQDLDGSSRTLSQFSSRNRTIDMPSQARAMVDAGLKLQGELIVARSELAALRQAYSEDNIRVRAASARVEELHRQLDKINGPADDKGAKAGASESSYPSIVDLPALGITFADLERKVLAEETLWATLTKQYEAAKVQEAKEIPTVQVLDEAEVPQRKSSPVRSDIVASGAVLSLFAACMFVFGAKLWENVDAEDERKLLAAEIAGAVLNSQHWISRIFGTRSDYARSSQ
jgi:uncharacterized protein involved in exopolysaccharide biosynthesis